MLLLQHKMWKREGEPEVHAEEGRDKREKCCKWEQTGLIHNTWACGFGKEIFMHHNEVVTGMWCDSSSMEWKHWAWASWTDLMAYSPSLRESPGQIHKAGANCHKSYRRFIVNRPITRMWVFSSCGFVCRFQTLSSKTPKIIIILCEFCPLNKISVSYFYCGCVTIKQVNAKYANIHSESQSII